MKKMRERKKIWQSFIAGILSVVIGIMSPMQTVLASDDTELDTYTAIKDDTYTPADKGYYGFFPAKYYQEEELIKTGIPALVYNSHTYLDFADVCLRLRMNHSMGPVFTVDAQERTITFQKDSSLVYIKMGPAHMEYTMPIATIWQDERLWIPAEWFAWLTGMTFFPGPEGYVVMEAPEKTALDVVLELYETTDLFDYPSDFGFMEEEQQKLDGRMRLFDIYDGIWSLEADKWKAVILGGFGALSSPHLKPWEESDSGRQMIFSSLIEQGYAEDFIKMILEAGPGEASDAFPVANDIRKMLFGEYAEHLMNVSEESGEIAQNFLQQANAATIIENAAYEDGRFRSSNAWGRYFNKMRAQAAEMKGKSIRTRVTSNLLSIGAGLDVLGKMFDYGCALQTYENRDKMALEGAKLLLEENKFLNNLIKESISLIPTKEGIEKVEWEGYIPEKLIEPMEKVVEDYEKEKNQFALSRLFAEKGENYLGESFADLLADAVGGVFGLFNYTSFFYKTITAFLEKYNAMRTAAEAFEHSLIGVVYQDAAYRSLQNSYTELFPVPVYDRMIDRLRSYSQNHEEIPYGFSVDAMETLTVKAYQFVKTRYVTRNLAMSMFIENQKAADNKEETPKNLPQYQEQEKRLEEDEERLSILAQYCREDLPIPENWNKRSAGYQDEYLAAMITPAYIKVKGQCVDAETGKPVEEVTIQLQDQENKDVSQFMVKEQGMFELYVPLPWKEQNCVRIEKGAASWDREQSVQAEVKEFMPWEKEFYKYYAYAPMEVYKPIKVKASHKDYPKYEENSFDQQICLYDQQSPVRQLELDLGEILLGEEPYYPYIRDHLLPKLGYASQETTSRYVSIQNLQSSGSDSPWAWDDRKGLLGADIADLDGDGVKDMLVYYFDIPDWEDWINGYLKDPPAFYADLYTLTEDRKVTLVDHTHLAVHFSTGFEMLRGGLMEVNGQTVLYVETANNAYFANGGGMSVYWYAYDKEQGKLRPYWEVGKTAGGSSDIEYSLLDRTNGGTEKKQVLYAIDMPLQDYQQQNGGKNPPASDSGTALELGFGLLGLPEPKKEELPNFEYSLYYNGQNGIAPTYWGTEYLKQSFEYTSSGTGNYQGRNMTVTVTDFTGLKEHIDQISE